MWTLDPPETARTLVKLSGTLYISSYENREPNRSCACDAVSREPCLLARLPARQQFAASHTHHGQQAEAGRLSVSRRPQRRVATGSHRRRDGHEHANTGEVRMSHEM